jgi:hypothetical protein
VLRVGGMVGFAGCVVWQRVARVGWRSRRVREGGVGCVVVCAGLLHVPLFVIGGAGWARVRVFSPELWAGWVRGGPPMAHHRRKGSGAEYQEGGGQHRNARVAHTYGCGREFNS